MIGLVAVGARAAQPVAGVKERDVNHEADEQQRRNRSGWLFKILALTGRRRMASMSDSVMWPPSSTGSGSRLSSARFTLRMTLNHSTRRQPSSLLKQIAVNADDHHRAAELLHADFALVRKQRADACRKSARRCPGFAPPDSDGRACTFGVALPRQDAQRRIAVRRLDAVSPPAACGQIARSPRFTVRVTRLHRAVAPGIFDGQNRHRAVNLLAVQGDDFIAVGQARPARPGCCWRCHK